MRPTDCLRPALLVALPLLVCVPDAAHSKKKDDSPPVVLEWVEQPACLLPLDARIFFQSVTGAERVHPLEATADSAFFANMPERLKKNELNWTLPSEAELETHPEAMAVLMQVREGLTTLAHEWNEVVEDVETSADEGWVLTEDGRKSLQDHIAKRMGSTLQAEFADYFRDFTDRRWILIPVYYGVKKDAGSAGGTVAKNLLKGLGKAAINSALSGGSGGREETIGGTPLEDMGELDLGIFALNMETGEFASGGVFSMGPIGIGAGSEKFNKDIDNNYMRGLEMHLKDIERQNKQARKELERLAKKEAKS